MTDCTIVSGGTAYDREAAIAARLDAHISTAVLLAGTHGGRHPLADTAKWPHMRVETIMAGCPCCNAGMVMRVMLDRILRRRPARLFIGLAQADHLRHLQDYLSTAPYAALVCLLAPVDCAFVASVGPAPACFPRAEPV